MLWRIGGISQRRNMLTVAYVCTSEDFIVYVYLSYPTTKFLEVHTTYKKKMDEQINQYDYRPYILLI